MRRLLAVLFYLGWASSVLAQSGPGNIGAWSVVGNPTASTVPSPGTSATMNAMLVGAFSCATNPSMLAFTTSFACATVLPTGLVPAFTGDVTNSAGSLAFTIANGAVTGTKTATNTIGFGNLIQGALNTTVCNPTGGTANFQACTPGQMSANHCLPNVQLFTTGTAATYTTPTCNSVAATYLEAELVGGGSSAAGSGTGSPGAGTVGNNTTFSTFTAGGGSAPSAGLGQAQAAGGAVSGCTENIVGGQGTGNSGAAAANQVGGPGGSSTLGGAGGGASSNNVGGTAAANTGSGGGAPGTGSTSSNGAASGASGGTCRVIVTAPAATYTYTVGAAVSGGAGGTNGFAGGGGAAGRIKVVARWQ